jgi:hypothetical protein
LIAPTAPRFDKQSNGFGFHIVGHNLAAKSKLRHRQFFKVDVYLVLISL